MLQGIGEPIDVHEVDEALVGDAIAELREPCRGGVVATRSDSGQPK